MLPIAHFTDGEIRLVSRTTGQEIKPGDTIPEPHGRGRITYLGPTVVREVGSRTARPGRVAVVRYESQATIWAFLPGELNARYEDVSGQLDLFPTA
ncbi:hypothetical protein [Streptomyces eurythermus]